MARPKSKEGAKKKTNMTMAYIIYDKIQMLVEKIAPLVVNVNRGQRNTLSLTIEYLIDEAFTKHFPKKSSDKKEKKS